MFFALDDENVIYKIESADNEENIMLSVFVKMFIVYTKKK